MSYAHRKSISASRTSAIVVVALIHAAIGYAIITGLAYTVIQKAPDGLKTFNVEEVLPPPPAAPAPAPKQQAARKQTAAAAPPAIVRIDAAPPSITPTVVQEPLAEVTPTAGPEPAYPAPAASPPSEVVSVPTRSATGDLQRLFRPDDYPVAALARREQGSVIVRLTVGAMGRVRACDVTSSSGSRALDNVSCQILQNRAVFTPARDSSGNPTTDTVHQEIRWVLA